IILLLLAFNGGWGGMGGFGGGQLGYDFPWLLNGQQTIMANTNNGFRDQMIQDNVTSVRDGISALSTQLCGCCGDMQMGLANGFAGVQQALCNGFAGTTAAVTGAQNAVTQQLYSNELASLNRSFAEQTANTQGFTGVNSGIADLRYTVATEACADRAAVNDALRDVIAANTASTQRILDQLCQDKIDAKNDEIARLRQEINMQTLAASQAAQNAFISQGFANEVDQLYNRLNNCPVPSTPVYGRQPIFTCNNNGCGCGCGGNF
ncbi:MAG: hypothetical protein II629_09040, partial [Ruminococcus sp.]|nr:hypothetical protein [Ruminococcus sp.]